MNFVLEMSLFTEKAINAAERNILLLKCQHCKNEKEVVDDDNAELPECDCCNDKTEWLYSYKAIDILRSK